MRDNGGGGETHPTESIRDLFQGNPQGDSATSWRGRRAGAAARRATCAVPRVVKDADCVRFLQWALPELDLRWQGVRRVRRQVCKRLRRRLDELRLDDLAQYRVLLGRSPQEWSRLDAMCRISVSRFYRDREVFERLEKELLPRLLNQAARGGTLPLRLWSVGCASGEEPYTLALMWAFGVSASRDAVEIIATDADAQLLQRARRGCYPSSSLRELPEAWRRAFTRCGREWCLAAAYRTPVSFLQQDIREQLPDGSFDLILCRNVVFTYFARAVQMRIARRLAEALVPGGLLLLGARETLPEAIPTLCAERAWLHRRRAS